MTGVNKVLHIGRRLVNELLHIDLYIILCSSLCFSRNPLVSSDFWRNLYRYRLCPFKASNQFFRSKNARTEIDGKYLLRLLHRLSKWLTNNGRTSWWLGNNLHSSRAIETKQQDNYQSTE
ncbi:hypothetical protein HELRODRAFT_162938 [Helobdella robusta]|uniref:Uncharacterized protein n=1 Tax=Helobdella robusta TaxID=6412 RepID=T1ETE0_HELRO|nr:hypothetical protein HELRODRAFT_162938 [Helobdella robusta]ESN99391.1 hypothetical protein HELRODRAFT_162938 [Helobdella robusta]